MNLGIGLNITVPGAERAQVLEWARRAEARGFSALGTIDRLVYPNWDPLVALGAAAAVTERIELVTSILIGPYRRTAVLAKQAATLDQLSGGRLVLGLGLGSRDDDYEAAGVPGDRTGAVLERQVKEMRRIWGGEKLGYAGGIGPAPVSPDGVRLILGGGVPAAYDRAARLAAGWIQGGSGPDQFREGAAAVREAWSRAGRSGEPRLMALAYFSLGPQAKENANAALRDSYYAILGEEIASMIAGSAASSPEMVRQYLAAFEQAGCDDLILFPSSADPAQVDLLADAAGL